MAPIVTTGVSVIGRKPFSRVFLVLVIFQPIPTFLELCVSALHRDHANTLQIIDVSSRQGPCYSSSSQKQYVRVILAQTAMQNFSAQKKKKRATDSM